MNHSRNCHPSTPTSPITTQPTDRFIIGIASPAKAMGEVVAGVALDVLDALDAFDGLLPKPATD